MSQQSSTATSSASGRHALVSGSTSNKPFNPTGLTDAFSKLSVSESGRSSSSAALMAPRPNQTPTYGGLVVKPRAASRMNPCINKGLRNRLNEMQGRCREMALEFPWLSHFKPVVEDLEGYDMAAKLRLLQDALEAYGSHYRSLRTAREEYGQLVANLKQVGRVPVVASQFPQSGYNTPKAFQDAVRRELQLSIKMLRGDYQELESDESFLQSFKEKSQAINSLYQEGDLEEEEEE